MVFLVQIAKRDRVGEELVETLHALAADGFRLVLSRSPHSGELAILVAAHDRALREFQSDPAGAEDLLKVETGSLYPALHRLVKRGWLRAEWGVSEAHQRAKFYQLTAAGKAQLLRERDRWSQLVIAIGRIMNPAPASKE